MIEDNVVFLDDGSKDDLAKSKSKLSINRNKNIQVIFVETYF